MSKNSTRSFPTMNQSFLMESELPVPILAIFFFLLLFILLVLLLSSFLFPARPLHWNLPPGRSGWPFLGESIEFLSFNRKGCPEMFIADRVQRYKSPVFRTSLFGEQIAVLCGPVGNKFMFSNEGTKVEMWWPTPLKLLVGPSLVNRTSPEARAHKRLLMAGFFSTESLMKCVPAMDEITRTHLTAHWEGKEEVRLYPSLIQYTTKIACKLFMSIADPDFISSITHHFHVFGKGLLEFPLDIPGTRFGAAVRAADAIRRELRTLASQRRALQQETGKSAFPSSDLLSCLLTCTDEDGKLITEEEIVNSILGLLFAGHETSSATNGLLIKCLAEQPRVHEKVLREQREIAASKLPGELLKWEDLQRMKYSWNVVSEVMRITPPVSGAFREATVDIQFEGYTIPKGWKLMWSANYTHQDERCYPKAMEFDESRFEGSGPPPFSYVPFGGGPRMCLGKEFARLNILVFLHNLVNRFDWELVSPNEKWTYDPLLNPTNGLPVRLRSLRTGKYVGGMK